jgi:MarR family transcriptional regulator, organic hydroperoxide resistance regulator
MPKTENEELADPVELLDQGLRRLMWLEQKRLGHLLAEYELTGPQFFVLVHLVHRDRGCRIGDLASRLFQSNATMTGIIDRLETERLVLRTRGGESDRRKVMVQVTSKGRILYERAKQSRQETFRRALTQFPARDIHLFLRLLNAYLKELDKDT